MSSNLIVVVDDDENNLAAAYEAKSGFPQFVFVFCVTMSKALEHITNGVAGVVTDCFMPYDPSPEVQVMYQEYLESYHVEYTEDPYGGKTCVYAYASDRAHHCRNIGDSLIETEVALQNPTKPQAYGVALMRRLQRTDQVHEQNTPLEGVTPAVLVTDLHRHITGPNREAGSYNGMVVLAPLLRFEYRHTIRGLLTEDEIVDDGKGSLFYLGGDQIFSLGQERGKANPVVWAEAYRRLEQQIAQR